MSSANFLEQQLSRRSALAYVAAVGSIALLAACDRHPLAPVGQQVIGRNNPFWAFQFAHDESVHVVISENPDREKFNLSVRRDGKDLEHFVGLTDKTVGDVRSDHIQVSYVDPPTA